MTEKTGSGVSQPDKDMKYVELKTTKGNIVLELNTKAAPVTVKNFLRYVEEDFYSGTIFHRVVPGFVAQGGGLIPDLTEKPTHEPIINESNNGLKNNRGTVAMARTPVPDSATSQFFVNLVNNDFLNYVSPQQPRYAVFGKVVKGMDVVDAIAAVATRRIGQHTNVPVSPVIINSATVISMK